MSLSATYKSSAIWMLAIWIFALLAYWVGGWVMVWVLYYIHNGVIWINPIRLPLILSCGGFELPFWIVTSLGLTLFHFASVLRNSRLGGRVEVPSRFRSLVGGAYDASLDLPFSKVIAGDFILITFLLMLFLVLYTYSHGVTWWLLGW